MRILPEREHSHDIIVLMNRFTEIAPLLLVPPVGIRIPELSLDSWRIEVAAVLGRSCQWHSIKPFAVASPFQGRDARDQLQPGAV